MNQKKSRCKSINLLFLILILLILASCSSKPNILDTYYKTSSENPITFTTLDNGVKVIIKEEHRHPIVDMNLFVTLGSADEDNSTRGVSHLVEHMAFKTIKEKYHMSETEFFTQYGVSDYNAWTTDDYVEFYFTSLPEKFEEVFRIYTDMIINPAFNNTELEKEKKVVKEEYTLDLDGPYYNGYLRYWELFYGEHPYRYPIIGYPEVFMNATASSIRNFQKKITAPDNLIVVIVGDIKTEKALSLAKETLARLPESKTKRKERPLLLPPKENIEDTIKLNVTHEEIWIGFRAPGRKTISKTEKYSMAVLNRVLNERLLYNIANTGLASSAVAGLDDMKDDYGIYAEFSLEPEKEPEVLREFNATIAYIKSGDFSEKDFERFKNNLILEQEGIFYTVTAQGDIFGVYAINENITTEQEMNEIYKDSDYLKNLSMEDVQKTAGKYLTNYVLLRMVPKNEN